MAQNIDFSSSDQIQTPQYPEVHLPSQEMNEKVSQAREDLMKSIDASSSNQEKEEPPQDFNIHQLIEECRIKVYLNESALNSKLLLINSQRLEKEQQEVKNVVEQQAERGNQPKHSLSMRYEHLSITPETEPDEVTEFNAENLLPIPRECEVTLEDESKCDVPISENSPICDNHSDIFSDSKIDDDISVDDDLKDIEYVEASLSNPEIVSIEEENGVEEENLLSITRLISNIESLNDNPTPDCVLYSFTSDNSLSDNFSPEFETSCDHMEETRSGNTTYVDNSLLEYDSFCFEIKPDQERLINLVKNDISDDSSNDPLLEEVNLFLASDNSIPQGLKMLLMIQKEMSVF
nr:hypothetical protein [Tanacetum cinerariifolium]